MDSDPAKNYLRKHLLLLLTLTHQNKMMKISPKNVGVPCSTEIIKIQSYFSQEVNG